MDKFLFTYLHSRTHTRMCQFYAQIRRTCRIPDGTLHVYLNINDYCCGDGMWGFQIKVISWERHGSELN